MSIKKPQSTKGLELTTPLQPKHLYLYIDTVNKKIVITSSAYHNFMYNATISYDALFAYILIIFKFSFCRSSIPFIKIDKYILFLTVDLPTVHTPLLISL